MAAKDNKDDHHSIKIAVEEFSSRTTLHGINSIANSKSRTGQITWSILLMLAFGYTVRSTILSFFRYSTYPFTTEVTEQFAGSSGLKFPAITVCPMNMFVKRKIELFDDDPLFHKYKLNLDICKESKAMRQKYNMTCGTLLMCTAADVPKFHSVRECSIANALVMIAITKSGKNFSLDFEEQFRLMYGPKLEHSIHVCKFSQEKCRASDFKKYVTSYGNCFQYNGDAGNVTYSYVKDSMMMVLDAKVEEYTKSPQFTEGFKFYIHDQGTFNSPEGGFVVSPGNIATVNVYQKKMIYLEKPFKSNCTNRKLQSYNTYTIGGCLNECYQEMLVRRCGCRTCGYTLHNGSQVRVCSANDWLCKRRLKRHHFSPKGCDCPPPCQQTTYPYQVSYSSFPDSGTARMITKYRNLDLDYQRKNLLAISIHYRATSYEVQEQKRSYSVEALLGELGGNLGLMVGCSVLTAAEILQLIFQLIFNSLRQRYQGDKRKVAWSETS